MNKALSFPDFRVLLLTASSACTFPIALAYFQPEKVLIAPDLFRQDIVLAQLLGVYAPLIGVLWGAASLFTAFGAWGMLKQTPWAFQSARWGQIFTALLSLGLWGLGKPLVAVLPGLIAATMLALYFSCEEGELASSQTR